MPRTALFAGDPRAYFSGERCPVTLAPVDQLLDDEGGILKVDGFRPPFSGQALLRWLDQRDTNPISGLRLPIEALHPVMTPDTSIDEYTRLVQALGARGWHNDEEVRQDVDARRSSPITTRKRARDAADPILRAMREANASRLWSAFVAVPDPTLARRELDHRCMFDALNAMHLAGRGVRELIYTFLETRARMWRFPDRTSPIYLDLEALTADFGVLCRALRRRGTNESTLLDVAETRGFAVARTNAHTGRAIVLYPPSVAQWIRGLGLPRWREDAAWRQFAYGSEVAHALWEFQEDSAVDLYFTFEAIHRALIECMEVTERRVFDVPYPLPQATASDRPVDQWLKRDVMPPMCADTHLARRRYLTSLEHARHIPPSQFFSEDEVREAVERCFDARTLRMYRISDATTLAEDRTLLPSDPYTNPRLLPALEYGLGRIEAEARREGADV
jgi:hypothetical protein